MGVVLGLVGLHHLTTLHVEENIRYTVRRRGLLFGLCWATGLLPFLPLRAEPLARLQILAPMVVA